MHVINATNVAHALDQGIILMRDYKHHNLIRREGRGGKATYEMDAPVTTVYRKPLQRVLFCPLRNINPFFHLFEALWILAGRRDVAWLTHFLPGMANYSDNGKTFHGAYGHRLRNVHSDQLRWVVSHLEGEPFSRRAVLSIFMSQFDHGGSKDIPCNDMIMFNTRRNAISGITLDMTVLNRSNDMIWGAYGTNAVQFSYIQELVASCLKMSVGQYRQVSNNFHVYEGEPTWERMRGKELDEMHLRTFDPYNRTEYHLVDGAIAEAKVHGLFEGYQVSRGAHGAAYSDTALRRLVDFDNDLNMFMDKSEESMNLPTVISYSAIESNTDQAFPFFRHVAVPLFNAFQHYKAGNLDLAIEISNDVDCDWGLACALWLRRVAVKRQVGGNA